MRPAVVVATLVLGLLCTRALADPGTDTAHVSDTHELDLPRFSFSSGFGVTAPDSSFKLNIRFRMQNRVDVNVENGEVGSLQARVRRLRLRLDGFVLSPKLRYSIQLGFTTDDITPPLVNNPPSIIQDAMIVYAPDNHWTVGFGQAKLPGNRERVTSSGSLQLVDRSAANSIFNIDRDFGIQATYTNAISGLTPYAVKLAVSTGEGRSWPASPGVHLSYTVRAELLPFGSFTDRGDYSQGDLAREEHPKLSAGVVFNFNNKALRAAGQRGNRLYDPRDITTYMADVLFKYRGWAMFAEWMRRTAADPVTRDPADPDNIVYVFKGHGLTLQGSYLFPGDFDLVGRYSTVKADPEIQEYVSDRLHAWTIGLTKYLRGHRVKLQVDATFLDELRVGQFAIRDTWNFRGQIELGI